MILPVSPSDSLQGVIDGASAGDTVLLLAGVHTPGATVSIATEGLSLVGEEGSTLSAAKSIDPSLSLIHI